MRAIQTTSGCECLRPNSLRRGDVVTEMIASTIPKSSSFPQRPFRRRLSWAQPYSKSKGTCSDRKVCPGPVPRVSRPDRGRRVAERWQSRRGGFNKVPALDSRARSPQETKHVGALPIAYQPSRPKDGYEPPTGGSSRFARGCNPLLLSADGDCLR